MNELQKNSPDMGMKDFLAVLRRRIWVILPILLLCLGGAYEWTRHTPKTWRAETQLMLVQRAPNAGNSVDDVMPQMMESIETQVGMIQSSAMAEKTLTRMQNEASAQKRSTDSVPFTAEDIQDAVKVTNPIDSNLLDITADYSEPPNSTDDDARKQARYLANEVAHAFADWKAEIARKDINDSIKNLNDKVFNAKAKLKAAQKQETSFKQANHLSDVDAKEKAANDQFYQSDTTVNGLQQEFASQSARVKALDTKLKAADAAVMSPNGVPDESSVLALQADLNRLKADLADEKSKYTPDFPGRPGIPSLSNLTAQIKNKQAEFDRARAAANNNDAPSLIARSNLSQEDSDAHVQLASIQDRLATAIQARQAYQQTMLGMPDLQLQYAQLQKNRELANNLYTELQAALNATLLQKDRASGNIQITQGAIVSFLPFKPNLKTNMLLGLALGLLLSLGLVMLLEQMDQRVRTLDEVRALVTGPIIGMLPKTSRGKMSLLTQGQMLPEFEEAFSLVRVNLSYVMRHSMMREQVEHQIILVTSAVPGEGKSVTAAQLARSMAEAGQSVILVDANLRRPAQNILFQTDETGGLTDVLSGQLPLDEAIATSDIEGLSILHSGVSSQNPTVLLSNPRLAAVMEALRFKADVVIVDAPDCSSVADTLLLTAHADCLLQVVRASFGDMETLHNSAVALYATGKKVTVLANGLTRPQQRAFKSRFAYAALSSRSEAPSLPQTFEKTMMMNRSRDLIFSKSTHKSLENPDVTPEESDAS